MTAHLVVHVCGHPAERDLKGNPNSQQWQAGQWAKKPCPMCWRADVDSASAEAQMFAGERGWPDLVGSGAQIGWARTIRGELVDSLPSRMRELVDMATARGQTFTDTAGAVVLAEAVALEQTSAGWWINERSRLSLAWSEVPGLRRRLKDAGETGKTAYALLLWASAAMES